MQNEKHLSNFAVRTLTAVIGGAIMVSMLIAGGLFLSIVLCILAVVGYYEMISATTDHAGAKLPGFIGSIPQIVGYITIVAWYLCVCIFDLGLNIGFMILVISFLVHMGIYVFSFPKYSSMDIMKSLYAMICPGVLLSFLYLVRALDNGSVYVWMIPICSWVCDTCAYLVGIKIGKHKMSPRLSPKKSIEGAIGGVLGSAIVGGVYAAFVIWPRQDMDRGPVVLIFVILSVAGALISMVGDLAASGIKREHEVKDYGHIIPGHGGVMDRFDSFIFVAPLVYIVCCFFA